MDNIIILTLGFLNLLDAVCGGITESLLAKRVLYHHWLTTSSQRTRMYTELLRVRFISCHVTQTIAFLCITAALLRYKCLPVINMLEFHLLEIAIFTDNIFLIYLCCSISLKWLVPPTKFYRRRLLVALETSEDLH